MINYAVIGCGGIGRVHALAIEADTRSRLVLVCDLAEAKAGKLAGEFSCAYTLDINDVLNDTSVDVAVICLPHHEHAWSFSKILSAEKHVICEKPLAITPGDIRQMVDASGNTSLLSTVAFQHRHSPLVRALKSCVSNGDFGSITRAGIDFRCKRTMDYYNADPWRGRWETEGGGTLINQAIHTIDLANLFLGIPRSVHGTVENRLHPLIEVEDFAEGLVTYEDGLELELRAENSGAADWEPLFILEGTRGGFTLKGSDILQSLRIDSRDLYDYLKGIEANMADNPGKLGKEDYGNMHNFVISDFTDALLEGRTPLFSPGDTAAANHIVLGFYQSASTGKAVDLPVEEYQVPFLNKIGKEK